MSDLKEKIVYCMKCAKVIDEKVKECECGCKTFVYGMNFKYENKKATCNCGNDKFSMISHLNMNPVYVSTYKCTQCGNVIGKEEYYEGYGY